MARTRDEHIAKMKECNKRTHDERMLWGLCIRCGKPLTDETTMQCRACLAKQAERRKLNREKNLEYQRRRTADHLARGLCLFCDEPAVPNRTRCKYHLEYYRMLDRKRGRKKNQAKSGVQKCENEKS